MDKKSSKRNQMTSSAGYAANGGKATKKNGKKSGKQGASQETRGIDWDLYEEMYSKTGFAKKYGKEDGKSKGNKLPGRTEAGRSRQGKIENRKSESKKFDNNHSKQDKSEFSSVRNNAGKFSEKKNANYEGGRREQTGHRNFNEGKNGRGNDRRREQNSDRVDRTKNSREDFRSKAPRTTASGEAICPLYKKCGGCHYQGTDYAKQLAMKQKNVQELLGKFGKVEHIVGMKDPYHYRNKVHATFDRDRWGNYISGIYEEGTHEVVAIEDCMIQNKQANDIINSIRGLLKSFKIKTYDEDTGYGLLRHVLVRTGFHSGEVMVVLVLGSPILPSKNNFVKALRQLHPEIKTVIINVNNKQTSMVLGDKETVIYGKGYIEDTLCGCRFRISPKSFYQVNPIQTEVLYNTAIELAGLNGKQRVIDAYCGIGTIGMIASKHAKEVIGVELNSDAVKDANANAKLNDIKNISFYNNDAGRFMVEMASQNEHADVVFMDPPRAGSDETFMDSLVQLSPKKVVYVSCNPETLARDLEYMTKKGYRVQKIIPVDMFPFTGHVETVCLLSRHK